MPRLETFSAPGLALAALLTFQTAGSVTGAWTGTLTVKHDGRTEQEHVHVVLKQNAGTLTGTAGPDADHQYRITKAKVAAANNTTEIGFEVIVDGVHMAYSLKLVDGVLKGEAKIEGEDGQTRMAAVELKPARSSVSLR